MEMDNISADNGATRAVDQPADRHLKLPHEAVVVLRDWLVSRGLAEVAAAYGQTRRWLRGGVTYHWDPDTNEQTQRTRAERVLPVSRSVEVIAEVVGYDLDREDEELRLHSPEARALIEADDNAEPPYMTTREVITAVRRQCEAAIEEGRAFDKLRAARAELKTAREKAPKSP